MLKAVSAKTVNPNTPASDKVEKVEHEVTLSDGSKRFVMASCPVVALEVVQNQIRMHKAMYGSF